MSRFQFVADHTGTSARPGWSVKRLCALLEVQRSSFYAWRAAAPARAARAATDAELAARIRAVHADDRTCGRPRITAELNDGVPQEQRVNHKRVGRVMREHGICGYRRRRRVRTTIPEPAQGAVPDLLGREFTAQAPNRVYVGDITYPPLAGGENLYLATVIDCYSRRLAGWAIADHMRTELVEDAGACPLVLDTLDPARCWGSENPGDGREGLHRRVPAAGGGPVWVHARCDAQGRRG